MALNPTQHAQWESHDDCVRPDPPGPRVSTRTVSSGQAGTSSTRAAVVRNLDRYRDYVQTSRGEWSVAKNGYVKGRPGWFSCRSACYLAAGRPVVVEDTGFGAVIPTGLGVLAFSSIDQAAAAIDDVEANYATPCGGGARPCGDVL